MGSSDRQNQHAFGSGFSNRSAAKPFQLPKHSTQKHPFINSSAYTSLSIWKKHELTRLLVGGRVREKERGATAYTSLYASLSHFCCSSRHHQSFHNTNLMFITHLLSLSLSLSLCLFLSLSFSILSSQSSSSRFHASSRHSQTNWNAQTIIPFGRSQIRFELQSS